VQGGREWRKKLNTRTRTHACKNKIKNCTGALPKIIFYFYLYLSAILTASRIQTVTDRWTKTVNFIHVHMLLHTILHSSRVSSVGTTTYYWFGGGRIEVRKVRRFFSSPQHPEWLCNPAFYLIGNRVKRAGIESHHSPLLNVKVRNVRSYTSTSIYVFMVSSSIKQAQRQLYLYCLHYCASANMALATHTDMRNRSNLHAYRSSQFCVSLTPSS
jgi:hypothetical protein